MNFENPFADDSNYYDLLQITADATPQEIRSAYLRAKTTYRKDSNALYTLMSETETARLLERIEEAYLVLSSVERRKEYDRKHSLLRFDNGPSWEKEQAADVVSIDRVPPMELAQSASDDILIPPATDFTGGNEKASSDSKKAVPSADQEPVRVANIQVEINAETEWSGAFLHRVREARGMSIDELSNITRITKNYIHAIEKDQLEKLPAAVFVRGFITQIAKSLKLPVTQVVPVFMERLAKATATDIPVTGKSDKTRKI